MFDHLFSSLEIGLVNVRNRIYVTPHETNFVSDDRDNLPGERIAAYCAERAKGGAGLIEVSMAIPEVGSSMLSPGSESHFDPLNSGYPAILTGRFPISGCDPRVVSGYSKLAKAVHSHGAKCFVEIGASGANYMNVLGVSEIPWPSVANVGTYLPFTGREMNQEDIEQIVEAHGKTAKYIKDGGLDGVDLHGTHGTLICEFLSPVANRRKDRYGGSLENRLRFLEEIIQRIREHVRDSEFAVCMRMIGYETFKGGLQPANAAEMATRLDGKVDMITADFGYFPQEEDWEAVPMYVETGYNLRITNPIKAVLKRTRAGVVGKYVDPLYADTLVANNQADMVAMTRALIADPELPNKAEKGRLNEIRPCIGVLQDCWGRMTKGLPISCTVNPVVSREREWGIGTLSPASIKKKVLIIGGGIAGLETARIAAERGHSVVIYEKSRNLGGQALLAGKLPGRSNIKAIVTWLIDQVKKLGVEIKFGVDVTSDANVIAFVLEEEKPHAVVVATGSYLIRTGFQPYTYNEIEGWNEPIVCTDEDVLENKVTVGQNVMIVDSVSFIEAPGLAELLVKGGKKVEVITCHTYIGLELKLYNHWQHLMPRLFSSKIKVAPFTWVRKVSGKTVLLYNVHYENDERKVENVDNLVLITGRMQNDSLYNAFAGKVKEVYLVGDANIAGARIGNAMYDGQRIGRSI